MFNVIVEGLRAKHNSEQEKRFTTAGAVPPVVNVYSASVRLTGQ